MTTIQIPNFKVDGKWVAVTQSKGVQSRTASGSVWYDMRTRCNPEGSIQARQPRYIGCTMSKNFKNFQFFVEWHMQQVGFGLKDYQIDKDLLFADNKEYHEDKCVLLPRQLNMFLISQKTNGADYPGVYFDIRRLKYQARLSVSGKMQHLGHYETDLEAFKAYKDAKEKEAKRWAERLKNNEFVVDKRVITRLESWRLSL